MAVVEGIFTATGVTANLAPEIGTQRASGQFNILLSGMVTNDQVILERSFDEGATFFGVKLYDGVDANEVGAEPETGVKYRLNCAALNAAGPVIFRLSN